MGKASRRKRERRAETLHVLERVSGDVGGKVRLAPPGNRPKISGSLGELIRPYMDDSIGIEQYRTLVTIGALAWNLSVRPEIGAGDQFERLLGETEASGGGEFRRFLKELKIRKGLLFPEDQRLIVHTEVQEQADVGFYLVAAAAAGVDEQNDANP